MFKKIKYIYRYFSPAFLFLIVCMVFDCHLKAQDISGSWKGELLVGDMAATVEVSFFKISNNLYSGTTYAIWRKISDKTAAKVHRERKLFNATVNDNVLTIMEFDTVHLSGETPASISGGIFTIKNDNGRLMIASPYPGIDCKIIKMNTAFPDSLRAFFKPSEKKSKLVLNKPEIPQTASKPATTQAATRTRNDQKPSNNQWETMLITATPPKGIFDQTKLPKKAIDEWISGTNLASVGKYKQAIDTFIASALAGSALSAYEIGLNLNFCYQIKQDFDLAAAWYQFAADNGNPNALTRLSVLISLGLVSPTKFDVSDAGEMSQKAFEQGCSFAALNNFSTSKFVDKDPAQTANWLGRYALMLEGAKAERINNDLKQAFMENYARVKSQSGLDLANTILLGMDGKSYNAANLSISDVSVTHLNGKYETEYAATITNPTDGSRPVWHFKVNKVFINGKPINVIRGATVGETFALGLKAVDLQRTFGQSIFPGFDDLYIK